MFTKYDKAIAGGIAVFIAGIIGALLDYWVASGSMNPAQAQALRYFTSEQFTIGLALVLAVVAVYLVPNKRPQNGPQAPKTPEAVS